MRLAKRFGCPTIVCGGKGPVGLTGSELKALGYTLEPNRWGDLGDIQAILVNGGAIQAASDNRGRGSARVFDRIAAPVSAIGTAAGIR